MLDSPAIWVLHPWVEVLRGLCVNLHTFARLYAVAGRSPADQHARVASIILQGFASVYAMGKYMLVFGRYVAFG